MNKKYTIEYLQENVVEFTDDNVSELASWSFIGYSHIGVITSGDQSVLVSDMGNGNYKSIPFKTLIEGK